MAQKKSSSAGKGVKKAAARPTVRKEAGRKNLRKSVAKPVAALKDDSKILKALYEIADAASAVKDMQSFYKKLHKIVGRLMYAENFFIALYDKESDLITWPYYVDTVDLVSQQTVKLSDFHGVTGYVLRHGKTLADADGSAQTAMERGEFKQIGSDSEGIAVPLKVKNQTIGIVLIQSYTKGIGYQLEDVKVLEFVAQHIATALTRARALEETRQRNAELAIINSVQEGLAKQLDLQGIIDLVGEKIGEIFKADTALAILIDQERDWITESYYMDHGKLTRFTEGPAIRPSLGAVLIDTRRPLLLGTSQESEALGAFKITSTGAETDKNESYLGVPILAGEKVIGTIAVQSYKQHAYGEADLRLIQTLANAMSVALQNAVSFKAEQERVAELQIINSIQQGLAAELDFQAIVDLVGDKLREVFNTGDLSIFWVDSNANQFIDFYAYEHGVRLSPRPPTKFDKFYPLMERLRTREPLVMNNRAEQRAWAVGIAEGTDESLCSVMVPFFGSGGLLGVVTIENHERETAFGEAEVRLLSTIASSMGVALENARLFEAEQERVAELAIINSVQEGLAKQLDFQGIVDLIGAKVGEIFAADTTMVAMYDAERDWTSNVYYVDRGQRTTFPDSPMSRPRLGAILVDTRKPLLLGTSEESTKLGALRIASADAQEDKNESYLGVPILTEHKVIGAMAVQSYKQNAYNQDHLRLLQTLANAMSVALENARLFEETQRLLKETEDRAAELAIINSVQQGLASKLDMQAIYDLVGDKIREIFNADTTYILSYDRAKQTVYSHYYVERGQHLPPQPTPFGPGLYSQIIQSRKPMLFGRNEDSEKAGATIINSPGQDKELNESFLGLPILLDDEVTGVVSVQSYKQDAYAENDIRLLTTLASALSIALENARLFDETQRLLKVTEDRAAELAIINSVQEGLASKLDMQAIYDLVGNKISEVFKAESAYIALYDHKTDQIRFPYVIDDTGKRYDQGPRLLSTGFSARIIQTKAPLVINQDYEKHAAEFGSAKFNPAHQPKAGLGVPMAIAQDVVGVVALFNSHENAFSESDVRLLQTLANSMSVALENARLFDETQQRNAELAIINAVQRALAAELDIQGIYDAVGEKLREIFSGQAIIIYSGNLKTRMETTEYAFEKGQRLERITEPLNSIAEYILGLNKTFVRNKDFPQFVAQFKDYVLLQGEMPISVMETPVIRNEGDGFYLNVSIMDMDGEKTFDESDVRLLETLANSMSIALENARLFDETQRLLKITEDRAAELSIVNSVQAGLASKLDMQAIYELVGENIREIFDAQGIMIASYDYSTETQSFRYLIEKGKRLYPDPRPFGGLTRHFIRTRQSVLINDNTEQRMRELGMDLIPGTENEKSGLYVPLIAENVARGMIVLTNMDRENAFSDSDVRLLQTLANSMSVALENARLFDEVQRKNAEISESLEQQTATSEILRVIASSPTDIQPVLDAVAQNAARVCGANDALIFRVEGERLRTVAHHGPIPVQENELDIPLNRDSVAGRSIELGKTMHIHDILSEESAADFPVSKAIHKKSQRRTLLVTPLVREGTPIGVIAIRRTKVDPFSDKQVALLKTFADQAAIAIENVRLFNETQSLLKETEDRAAELAVINSVQEGLASKLDMQAIYDLVGDRVREIFDAQAVLILAFDDSTELTHIPYNLEKGRRFHSGPYPFTGLHRHLIRAGKTVLINENAEESQVEFGMSVLPGTQPSKSMLFVPLKSGSEVKGAISLQNIEREWAFTESDVRLLETLASSMGVAIENARLFDETQRLLQETEQRAQELAIINSVQEGLASKLDVQAIYDLVGDKIRDIFHAQGTAIFLFDHETEMQATPYCFLRKRFPIDDHPFGGVSKLMIDTHQPRIFRSNDEYRALGGKALENNEEYKSGMYVPLTVSREIKGMIGIANLDKENAYDDSDLRLLNTLANSMSVALENARLFDETQRLLKETEDRAAELAIINSVQEGLASKLDFQGIIDLVGDKIREIFDAQATLISLYDSAAKEIDHRYLIERGQRLRLDKPVPIDKFRQRVVETRQSWLINSDYQKITVELGEEPILEGEEPKSLLFAPMIAGNEVTGIISLQNLDRENAFSDSDTRLLSTIAASMSVALENARLFEETQRLLKITEDRAAELAIINSVQEGLASKLDMQAIYDLVGDKICKIFSLQTCFIMVYDKEHEMELYPYIYEDGARQHQDPIPHDEHGFGPLVMRTRQPMLINEKMDERAMEIGSYIIGGGSNAKSALYVPLLIGAEAKGVISVQNIQHEHAFTDSDLRLLTTLAASMSVALESARLFNETEQRAAELATVNTVSAALASELDVSALIHLVGEQTRTIFKADIAYVALLDEASHMINFPYDFGEELPSIQYGEGLTSKIIETGKPLLINQDVDRESQQLGASIVGILAQSYLGVPIFVSGRAVGVVSVQSTTQHGVFNAADERLLSTIAANVGSALHNARLYREAQESRASAEHANTAKSAFLANMSHELRTPLNAIIGFTRIVRRKAEGALPEKQTENLDKVLTSAEHLLNLINTVLDIAKIEAGRMDVNAANFNISALADLCANTAAPLLKPNVRLEKNIDPSLGIVHSDQDKLKQIILNLLSNAAKFTHAGKIVLQMQRAESTLIVNVTDSGIGISEEALGRIFEEFQQADTSTTRQYGGTGLGLAISRNLAQLLGGDLTATSEPGKGSTFTLTIPIQYGHKSAARPASGADLEAAPVREASQTSGAGPAKKRVLVIDDDPDAVYLLQENLRQDEFEVIGALTGAEGQQKARELKPDAILLDILMPDKDGWQVLHDLKVDDATADIPVILLTIVDKKALGFRLGAAAYLLKPLDPVAVMDALKRVTAREGDALKHILVVDDDPHIADMLHQLLPATDFALESAEDGVAGLEAIAAHRPDAILLDLMMPRLDGFGVIEKLRADPATSNLPIIVISAKELTDEESALLKESVKFVMRKQGFDGETLVQEINRALEEN